MNSMELVWNPPGCASALADLFVQNCDRSYISHGDIACGRALDFTQWVPDLQKVVERELERILEGAAAEKRVAAARGDSSYLGFAIVRVEKELAEIEDIIIERGARSSGVGGAMMRQIFADLREKGVRRVRAESGANNTGAHAFAERLGFAAVSIILEMRLS